MCAMGRCRCNTFETDLNAPRPPNRIFDIYGRDETLRLHLTNTKLRVRYLVDPRKLALLTRIRSAMLSRNKTIWANTDTRLCHNVLFNQNLNRGIAIRELGRGDSLTDFLEYQGAVAEGDLANNIQDLQGLMSRRRIDRKAGTTNAHVSKQLIYGETKCQKHKLKLG